MKINKKNIMPLMFVLGISLVLAGAGYYAVATYTVTINQPISVTGDGSQTIPICKAEDTCLSDNPITIKNTDSANKVVTITDNNNNPNISVSYVGKMIFVGKNLETGAVLTNTEEIVYSITGDSFVATGIPEEYTLIYYPDIGTFTENVAGIIKLTEGSNAIESLPILLDGGDDYCVNPLNSNALVCNGAKLWLVENSYVADLENGVWTPSSILFETDLITYTVSSDGEVLVPALSTITVYPAFTIDEHATGGSSIIDVTVA